MIYEVNPYYDQLRAVGKKKLSADGSDAAHYFDDEKSAKAFIRQRAIGEVKDAKRALLGALQRQRKCERKYA